MKSEKLENIALGLTALGSLIVTGTLVASCVWILMFLASQLVMPVAFAQTRPGVELEAAINKEQVDGDLAAAIAAYQKIAADGSAPRDVRAKALLRLAGCYEKLGRQANGVYQQIVRDFADQPAAAQARTRLAALKKEAAGGPANLVARKITTREFNYYSDGRSVVYRDAATRELIAGDVAGRLKKVIFKPKPGDLYSWWAPSKDFSMVAIAFANKPGQPGYIAVVKTDGTGYRELVRNDEQGKKEGLGFDFVRMLTWSWDNRELLVAVSDADPRTQHPTGGYLLAVSVSEGKRRRVAEVKSGYPFGAMLSPDGRFVAYDVMNPASSVHQRIFVLPVSGGKPSLIHEERGSNSYPGLLDWTADGRYLAITAATAAGPALHLFPIEEGQAGGPPILVRPGRFFIGSSTPAGALAAWLVPPDRYVAHLASLDPDGRPGPWRQLDFGGHTVMQPYRIDWSPDSNQVVYTAESDDVGQRGGRTVRVRNLTTGQDREIHRTAARGGCLWSTQPSRIICSERPAGDSLTGKLNFYSISESGAIEPGREFSGNPSGPGQASRDGRALYVGKSDPGGGIEFVRWEIETGQETVLDRSPSQGGQFRLSPDESWLLRSADLKLEVRPTSGGDWKPLVTVNKAVTPSNVFGEFAITADSRWVVYRDVDSAGKHGLFRVPISGGAPERLGDYAGPTGQAGAIEISPDGRKILTGVLLRQTREAELWLLENFVPAVAKR